MGSDALLQACAHLNLFFPGPDYSNLKGKRDWMIQGEGENEVLTSAFSDPPNPVSFDDGEKKI